MATIDNCGGTITLNDLSHTSYAPDSLMVRIYPIPQHGPITRTGSDFRIRYQSYSAEPLDLRPAENMGFRDDLPGDGKGGWTDQGGANDLSAMNPGRKKLGNVEFDIVDPEENRGKSCIVLRGKARPSFPLRKEVTFAKASSGNYLYLLHATAWDAPAGTRIGTVVCRFEDGATQTIPVVSKEDVANFWKPQPLARASVGWRGDNDVAAIGLYVTRFKLDGKRLKSIAFESAGESVWMIVAASLSEFEIDPKQGEKVVIGPGPDWTPVTGDARRILPGSILDFSDRLDAPAGKYGFARNRNGAIVFERRPGVPVRFYGVNLCFSANYMEKKQTDRLVDECAAIGYNLIRLHHFDRDTCDRSDGTSTRIRPEILDRMDYLAAACKKRGIYLTLDLYIKRRLYKGELPEFPGKSVDAQDFKGMVHVSGNAMRNWETYAANLLNHVNPYTGIAWKAEPAVVDLDLINEDAVAWTSLVSGVKPLFEVRFEAFLKRTGARPSFLERSRYWKQFLLELYPPDYARMHDFLRSIGVRQMITDQNHSCDILTMLLREPYDLVENHFYWAHPAFLDNGWRLPALIENQCSISKGAGGLNQMFQTRQFGKPFMITEWNYAAPNPCNAEGAFLTAAYASLQDWSALCRFAYSHDARKFASEKAPLEFFDLANDPLRLLSERAGYCFFLREDIASSKMAIPVLLNRKYFESPDAVEECGLVPQQTGLVARTGNVIFSPGEPVRLPAGTKALIAVDRAGETEGRKLGLPTVRSTSFRTALGELEKNGVLPKGSTDVQAGKFVSTTGELTPWKKGNSFLAVSPRSEGFLLEAGRSLKGKFASVANRRIFCGILVASRDDRPLAESGRILILHLTSTKCTGMTFSGPEMRVMEKWGTLPLLIRNGEAKITLNRDFSGWKLYAVGFNGKRLYEVPFLVRNRETTFTAKTTGNGGAVAVYELSRK